MTSVLEQMSKRFEQRVRKDVRDHVKAEKEPPPLTLWCSAGTDPRKLFAFRVGAASSSAEIHAKIREAIREHKPSWVAIGRGLHVRGEEGESEREDGLVPTKMFGLIFVSADAIHGVENIVVAGEMGAWKTWRLDVVPWSWVQQALRTVQREIAEGDVRERAARLLEGGGDGA